MANSDELQALGNISIEVSDAKIQTLMWSQCMKVQNFVLGELRKQTERHREICKYLSSSNFKLETEIKFAKEQIKSLNIAIETIKLGNIELTKEHLLCKDNKAEIFERTKLGAIKYENMWLAAKERYENIPIIRNIIDLKNRNQILQANINVSAEESKQLTNKIEIKKNDSEAADRELIIKLADDLVRERPKILMKINENIVKIKDVVNEIEVLEKEQNKQKYNVSDDQQLPQIEVVESINSEKDSMGLPKLHLQSSDLDIFSFKLDQIIIAHSENTTSIKRTSLTLGSRENNPYDLEERNNKKYISPYFDISLNNSARNDDKKLRSENFSEKKLIHILEDVTLDKKETYEIIKKLEVNQLQETTCITSKNTELYENISTTQNEINEPKLDQTTNSVQIEEINEEKMETDQMTSEYDFMDPPSQFKDVTQSSQEKKTVTFNIPPETEIPTQEVGNLEDKSQVQILNNSTASDDSYATLKDKMLKNRNLDLSPQFVYSKPTVMPKQQEDRVTSKFFESQDEANPYNEMNDKDYNEDLNQDQICKTDENANQTINNEICTMDENIIVVSSPKQQDKNLELPVTGFLFNHGPQGITDSLNLSISTAGYEDNEDFPHCLDSSLLLSPKADIPASVSSSQNHEVLSQGVPNFLGGFRKAALSFFGTNNSSDPKPKPDSGESENGNFNFAFGKEEKKGRGGFFSMFH